MVFKLTANGQKLQAEAAAIGGEPMTVERLTLAAARRLGEEALKQGLLEIEVRQQGGQPVVAVRAIVAKP